MSEPDFYQCAPGKLAEEAERLQTQLNEFIGRCTMADVRLPGAVYDANAELLRLPGVLRQEDERAARTPALRRGMRQAFPLAGHRR